MSTILFTTLLGACVSGAPPRFQVGTTAGTSLGGPVEHMDADWNLDLASGTKVAGSDLLSLRREETPLPRWPREPYLAFANGDRLAGTVISCDGRAIEFRPALAAPSAKPLSIPMSRASIVWRSPPPTDWIDSDPRSILVAGARRRDALIMRNGDIVHGDLVGLDSHSVSMQTTRAERFPADKVTAIALSTELARARLPKGRFARLILTDGSRLVAASAAADARDITVQTEFGQKVVLPWERVLAFNVVHGKAVYLSDLEPKRYAFVPYLVERYAWSADRNVEGGQIALRTAQGVSYFDKGLGLHSRCTIAYALGAKYQRFESVIGLDEESGKNGAASVQIYLDGKKQELPELKRLTHAAGSTAVRMDVSGANELVIEVDWGEGGHVGDVVDLADARLILAR